MTLVRALVLLLIVACGAAGGGVFESRVAAASATTATAGAGVEDAATQAQAFSQAYNLLLDNYVHPLDTAALLNAGWDNLTKEAVGKAAAPGPAPTFVGNRAADLQSMSSALKAYLGRPNSSPEGFVAAYALVQGMVQFVNEGHTYFLDPQQYTDYQAWSRGDDTYVGIGISVSAHNAQPHIVEVYDDTPAQEAGLLPGDTLVSINGQAVAGLVLDQMTALVRGPAGTSVEIVVDRGPDDQEMTFDVARAEIHLQFVSDKVIGDDVGYIALRGFPEPSVVDTIEQDVAQFQQEGVHGLVLDLRGNSGGRIDVGTRLLGDFLPGGTTIYREVDKGGQTSTHSTRGGTQFGLPLVVLVDGSTASMGEIFASAVQEHGAATILGSTPTSGSVAAAQVFGLPDGSGLQVTVFEIESADGKPLNKIGVTPDELIPAGPDDASTGNDPVLTRAVEILEDESAGGPAAVTPQVS